MWKLDRKGFTLVEIMIVIVIIGILAAIAVPNFISTRDTAHQEACRANLRQLKSAIQMYRIDNGSYPAAVSWTVLKAGTDLDPYMGEVPSGCPGNGTYTYISSSGTITCNASGHSLP